jgi:hypothetical protein
LLFHENYSLKKNRGNPPQTDSKTDLNNGTLPQKKIRVKSLCEKNLQKEESAFEKKSIVCKKISAENPQKKNRFKKNQSIVCKENQCEKKFCKRKSAF